MGEIEKHQHVSGFWRLDKSSGIQKMYPVNQRTGKDKYAEKKLLKILRNGSDKFGEDFLYAMIRFQSEGRVS